MTIREIKTAINNRVIENGGRVYSNETDEGFDKPSFFVEIVPVSSSMVTPVYEEKTLDVQIHYEPAVETEEECLRIADSINDWFFLPLKVGDRSIHAPDSIEHITDDDITLYSSFEIQVTLLHGESKYTDEPMMGELETNIFQGGNN